MIVEVELFGRLMPDLPRIQTIELDEHAAIKEAASILGIDLDQVGLITINGVQSEEQDQLLNRCRLCFFMHMSGG